MKVVKKTQTIGIRIDSLVLKRLDRIIKEQNAMQSWGRHTRNSLISTLIKKWLSDFKG